MVIWTPWTVMNRISLKVVFYFALKRCIYIAFPVGCATASFEQYFISSTFDTSGCTGSVCAAAAAHFLLLAAVHIKTYPQYNCKCIIPYTLTLAGVPLFHARKWCGTSCSRYCSHVLTPIHSKCYKQPSKNRLLSCAIRSIARHCFYTLCDQHKRIHLL